MSYEVSRSSDDSPASEPEGCAGTDGLSDVKRRQDDSPTPLGESLMTGDGAAMEETLHNASQVQAYIG